MASHPACRAAASQPVENHDPRRLRRARRSADRVMRTLIVSLGFSFAFVGVTHGQTTLTHGDISVLGGNADADDAISFVIWRNIAAGTVIKFTDNSFKSASSSTTSNNILGSENFTVWTAPAGGLPAGSVIRLVDPGSGSSMTVTGGGTSSGGRLSGISADGDQIFAYQGSGTGSNISGTGATETFSGTLLYGVNFANSGFIASGTADSNSSYLPSDLNALDRSMGGANTDNIDYAGLRSGLTLSVARAAVSQTASYTANNTRFDLSTTDFTSFASTQNLTWDTNGTTAGTGGTGTWTATANTVQFTAGTNTFLRWVNSTTGNEHNAIFGGTAGTVTVSGTVIVNDVTFNTTGYTVTGGIINLFAGSTDIAVSTGTSTIASQLTGTSTLNKLGTGTLSLGSGASDTTSNTYTGTAVVEAGSLQLNKAADTNAVSGAVQIDATGTLANSRSNQIPDAATVTNNGTWNVGNSNSETIGLLAGTNTSAVLSLGTGGVSLTVGTASDSSYNGTITGPSTATLAKQGSGKLTLSHASSTYGAVNINAGTLSVSDVANSGTNSALGTGGGTSAIGLGAAGTVGTLEFTGASDSTNRGLAIGAAGGRVDVTNSAAELSMTGVVTGAGALTKWGDGTLTLSNTSSNFTGGVTVEEGTLAVTVTIGASGNSALGHSSGGAILVGAVTGTSDAELLAITPGISVGRDIEIQDAGITSGTRGVGGSNTTGAVTFSGGLHMNNRSATLLAASGGVVEFSGIISGTTTSAGLIKGGTGTAGQGTVILSGINTYTGPTRVLNGTLQVNANAPHAIAGALGNSSSQILLGDTLANSNHATLLIGSAGITIARDMLAVAPGANTGVVTFGADHAAGTSVYSGALTLDRSIYLTAADGVVLEFTGTGGDSDGQVSGVGAFEKDGGGTLVLGRAGGNSYSGGTTIVEGSVVAGNTSGSATGTGDVIITGGTLTGGNSSGTIGFIGGEISVSTGGHIAPGSSTGILTTSGGLTFSGGTFAWEIAALSTASPGINYDMLAMTAGDLDIVSGTLQLSFTGAANAPNIPHSFWDIARAWTIINNSGSGAASGTLVVNNSAWAGVGSFNTEVVGNDLVLNWTPANVPEPSSLALIGLGGLWLARRPGRNARTRR